MSCRAVRLVDNRVPRLAECDGCRRVLPNGVLASDLDGRIQIKNVHPAIYEGSDPSRFFSLSRFRVLVNQRGYEVAAEFNPWVNWIADGDTACSAAARVTPS